MEWIKCEDKTPPPFTPVWVLQLGRNTQKKAWRNSDNKWFHEDGKHTIMESKELKNVYCWRSMYARSLEKQLKENAWDG